MTDTRDIDAGGDRATSSDGVGPEKPIREKKPGAARRGLRLWPAAVVLALLWGSKISANFFDEVSFPIMIANMLGPLVCSGAIVLWWLFASRAPGKEKVLGLLGLAAIVAVTVTLSDPTVRGFGSVIFALPWGISGFALALLVTFQLPAFTRTWVALSVAFLGFGYWDLVRMDDFRGNFSTTMNWRWQPTAEDTLLAGLSDRRRASDDIAQRPLGKPEWSGFRGPKRDGVQPGLTLGENWEETPPKEIWRVRIGPGWSSFSVAGSRLFTQEQWGEEEVVSCYDAESGGEVWVHKDKSRFWEVVGGAGPRATPTLSGGALYSLGAAGLLNRLDPTTGDQVWQRDINKDAKRTPPTWGYSSSPLVTNGLVIVHAGGQDQRGLLAYDAETGDLKWQAAAGDHSYSSPHLAQIGDKTCVLMITNKEISFVDPTTGKLFGAHEWPYSGYRVVQPLVLDKNSVLMGTAMGTGTRRLSVRFQGEKLITKEQWTSRGMSPYYNDYVMFEGHLYGFDNSIFACVNLKTGKRRWKKGRYGNGQVLLLPQHKQLLVLSEEGMLVLLRANPKRLEELTKYQVLEGRTWNHPVVVGDRVYVRNAEEAACFSLPLRQGQPSTKKS